MLARRFESRGIGLAPSGKRAAHRSAPVFGRRVNVEDERSDWQPSSMGAATGASTSRYESWEPALIVATSSLGPLIRRLVTRRQVQRGRKSARSLACVSRRPEFGGPKLRNSHRQSNWAAMQFSQIPRRFGRARPLAPPLVGRRETRRDAASGHSSHAPAGRAGRQPATTRLNGARGGGARERPRAGAAPSGPEARQALIDWR